MDNGYSGKRVLIIGKGISGEGAKTALDGLGAECAFYEDTYTVNGNKADMIVVSPGISREHAVFGHAAENGIEIIGEAELGYRINKKPVIAITGTNGKTTVTELIGKILERAGHKVAVCGNIGNSFSLAAFRGGYDYAVVEISSFQLETVKYFKPYIAVITNISPDHLDRHKTMGAYCAAKRKIAAKQTKEDYLVLSQDDIPLYALEDFMPQSSVMYTSVRGKMRGAYVTENKIYYMGEYVCDTDRVRMEGEHNLKNALSAVCAAKILNVKNKCIVSALTDFLPDAHRLNLVARKGGKNYYNDSKGTNIMASVCAAEYMSGDTCLIAGGSDKGYEYDELFTKLPPGVVRIAAVGETAAKIKRAADKYGFANIEVFDDFTKAFLWAKDGIEENVLLSPASASFDMFTSYSERGEAFERLVRNVDEK